VGKSKENEIDKSDEKQEETVMEELQMPEDTLTVFEHLQERGVLVAVTNCSDINYNMYNNHPSGFEYELLKDFCDTYDLKLEMIVNDNMDSCFRLLDSKRVDVLATGVGLTKQLKKKYLLSNPIFTQKSVLVQRMPKDWGSMSTKNEIESQLLRSPLDLAGKTVHVTKGLHSAKVLEHLSEEIGDTIYVVECDTLNPVELMRLVNEGQIDYTVVDEYIARMASYNLNSVDTKLAISLEQPIGWAIKQQYNDTSLLKALNDWIDNAEQKHLRKVMLRYVKNGKYISSRREESNKRLSSFDNSIKKTARKIGWDWRLLAALIYQESRFKVDLESEKGAFGLMQLMPSVMKRYGIDYDSSVEEQLDAGGKLISYLDKSLKNKVVDSLERVKFILAAYNAGLGHVYDAQRLAQKYGKAPDLWDDNVDYYILNKSKYLNDTCCKSGFLRGTQTYRFVEEIMDRYHHYQALLD
jgi:membrane-bound lytic murein transglycosylase F